jgi:hypothetical protein
MRMIERRIVHRKSLVFETAQRLQSLLLKLTTTLHSRNRSWRMAPTVLALTVHGLERLSTQERFQDHFSLMHLPSAVLGPFVALATVSFFINLLSLQIDACPHVAHVLCLEPNSLILLSCLEGLRRDVTSTQMWPVWRKSTTCKPRQG